MDVSIIDRITTNQNLLLERCAFEAYAVNVARIIATLDGDNHDDITKFTIKWTLIQNRLSQIEDQIAENI